MSDGQPQSNPATSETTNTSNGDAVAGTTESTPRTGTTTTPTEQPMPVDSPTTQPTATATTNQPENGTAVSTSVVPSSGSTAEVTATTATLPATNGSAVAITPSTVPSTAVTPSTAPSTAVTPSSAPSTALTPTQPITSNVPAAGTTNIPSTQSTVSTAPTVTTMQPSPSSAPVVMAATVPTSTIAPTAPSMFSNWIFNEGNVITGLGADNPSLKILITHLEIFKIIWDTLENIYQRIKKLSPALASLILFHVCVLTNIVNYFGPKLVHLCKTLIMLWVDVIETIVRLTLLPIEKFIEFILTFIRIGCGPIFGTFCSHRLNEVLDGSRGMVMAAVNTVPVANTMPVANTTPMITTGPQRTM